MERQIHFLEGSLTAPLEEPVDLLCTNPPYIPSYVLKTLAPEIAHEPVLALDGGPDGLNIIRTLLESTGALRPGGTLLMEIGHDQEADVLELAEKGGWKDPVVHPDLDGIPRVLEARSPN